MAETPLPRRAALYVDFDNVFMALLRWDERAAYAFGERPDAWLAWLERDPEQSAPLRRVLVRRCYLNPGRYLDFPPSGPVAAYRATQGKRNRLYFSEFRASFVQAAFDVVDCPPVASLKNSADMKMALDIRESLDHPTRFEEFVILSGDSDFLPALTRLRAHDRRVTILAQDTAKQAYLAAADEVVGLNDFANSGMGALPIAAFDVTPPARDRAVTWSRAEPPQAPDPARLRDAAVAWLREFLAGVPDGVVPMTLAGDGLRRAFPTLKETNYAGAGQLERLIREAGDPRLAVHGPSHHRRLYDPQRHAPADVQPTSYAPQPEDTGRGPVEADKDSAPPVAGADTVGADEAPEWAAGEGEQPDVASDAVRTEEALAPEEAYAALAEPPAPEPAPEPARPMSAAERDAFIAETVAKVRDLLWGRRDIKDFPLDLPAFSSAEIGFVLHGIVGRSPFGPMELERTAFAIAAAGAERRVFVSPREVVAIIRWLLRGRVSFRDPMPPTAALHLAEALYDQIGRAVERATEGRATPPHPDERMSEDDWAALEAWAVSELSA